MAEEAGQSWCHCEREAVTTWVGAVAVGGAVHDMRTHTWGRMWRLGVLGQLLGEEGELLADLGRSRKWKDWWTQFVVAGGGRSRALCLGSRWWPCFTGGCWKRLLGRRPHAPVGHERAHGPLEHWVSPHQRPLSPPSWGSSLTLHARFLTLRKGRVRPLDLGRQACPLLAFVFIPSLSGIWL